MRDLNACRKTPASAPELIPAARRSSLRRSPCPACADKTSRMRCFGSSFSGILVFASPCSSGKPCPEDAQGWYGSAVSRYDSPPRRRSIPPSDRAPCRRRPPPGPATRHNTPVASRLPRQGRRQTHRVPGYDRLVHSPEPSRHSIAFEFQMAIGDVARGILSVAAGKHPALGGVHFRGESLA